MPKNKCYPAVFPHCPKLYRAGETLMISLSVACYSSSSLRICALISL